MLIKYVNEKCLNCNCPIQGIMLIPIAIVCQIKSSVPDIVDPKLLVRDAPNISLTMQAVGNAPGCLGELGCGALLMRTKHTLET